MIVGGRAVGWGRLWALPLLVTILFLATLSGPPEPAMASHLCGATGSPAGPFDLETYEAADYKYTYGRALELSGFNQLFPEYDEFALPRLESGDRGAGSEQTADPYIPPVLLKAIAWIESGWAQASYEPLVQYGEVGPALVSHDCGYGIMQVTSGMQNVTGVPNLDQAMIGGHYAFNIARGAKILGDKWNAAPEYRPIVGDRDPRIIENWYFALWGYNGFVSKNHPLNPAYDPNRLPYSCGPEGDGLGHDRSAYPYQELVLDCAAHPPYRDGAPLWEPVETHLPDLSDPQFAGPLGMANFDACSQQLECAAMDIPTPNTSHTDPAVPGVDRATVLGAPVLAVSQDSVALPDSPPGGEVQIAISNAGSGLLAWRATSLATWLHVSRAEGVALGADLGGRTATLTLSGNGLGPGDYAAQIIVESMYAGVNGAQHVVQVTMHVGCGSPDGTVDAADALQILRHISGLPACMAEAGDVNCDGRIDAVDALTVLRFVTGLQTNVPSGCQPLG